MYKGGTIFVDHASGLVHVEHQITFTADETARAKLHFEKMAAEHGVQISAYQADNGVFRAHEFVQQLKEQKIHFSGVGAHHQNGIAERAIQTVTNRARTMMLHAFLHWPEQTDVSLWPMALQYATHLLEYYSMPRDWFSSFGIICM
jgi:hypothetical protein